MSCAPAAAQCAQQWLPNGVGPGLNGPGAVTRWDPDGPGPLGERIVVSGLFSTAGGVAVQNIGSYDPGTGTWAQIGNGLPVSGPVVAAANGDLYALGGIAARDVWRWNGSTWLVIGSVPPQTGPYAPMLLGLAIAANGDLFVSGDFPSINGVLASNLARWDGAMWHVVAPGAPVSGGVDIAANGDVLVFHRFGMVGGIQRWNGTTWQPFATPVIGIVQAILHLPNGELIAGGSFTDAGGVYATNIARWDGVT